MSRATPFQQAMLSGDLAAMADALAADVTFWPHSALTAVMEAMARRLGRA